MSDSPSTLPTQPGLYHARSSTANWFHYIVSIEGKAPYLSYRAWDRRMGAHKPLLSGTAPIDMIFGPRIEVPSVNPSEVETSPRSSPD